MNKNVVALLLTILTAFGAPTVVNEVTDTTPAPDIVLDAPDEAEVGELVRLTYAARKVEWKLPGVDYEIDEQRAWISFRTPGVYQIIVSGLVDSDVKLVTHDIRIKTDQSVLVPDETPTPAPRPDDIPEPTPDPLKPSYGIAAEVTDWCQEAGVDTEVARALGDNFINAASTTDNVPDLMTAVANANRDTDQSGAESVLVKIQVWMIETLTGEGFVEHQCAFSEIGTGFLDYAKAN